MEIKGGWNEGYVALIDILGFSSGMQEDNLHSFFNRYDKSIQEVMSQFKDVQVEYIVFSDTIVLYTEKANQKSFSEISSACSMLFFSLLTIGFPLRGCISYGKYHLQKTTNGVILAGKPIIDAYQYEKKQNWIGIMLSPKIFQNNPSIKNPNTLSRYNIIRKCGEIPFSETNEQKYEGYALLPSNRLKPNEDKLIEDILYIILLLGEKKSIAPDIRSQIKYNNTVNWLFNCFNEITGSGGPDSPDIYITTVTENSEYKNFQWKIPLSLKNSRGIVGENIKVFFEIKNPEQCEVFLVEKFIDVSNLNPGRKIFSYDLDMPLLKGSNLTIGYLNIKMKGNKKAVDLWCQIQARNMRTHVYELRLNVTKKFIKITRQKDYYID